MSDCLRPHGLYRPWNSPGQNTGVGSYSLLQGIFPTQGWNPSLPHCRQILYQLSHKGSPRILECVAYPFSRGSSRPRNRTWVSCIAGGFFTNWAISEALINKCPQLDCPTEEGIGKWGQQILNPLVAIVWAQQNIWPENKAILVPWFLPDFYKLAKPIICLIPSSSATCKSI